MPSGIGYEPAGGSGGGGGGGGSAVTVKDENATLTGAVNTINFVGTGVTASTAGGGAVDVNIPGGAGSGLAVRDEGIITLAAASALNFVGAGVTTTDGGSGTATVTIPGSAGGPPTGAAGGALTGTYPNPTLAAASVATGNIVDGTIRSADVAVNELTNDRLAAVTAPVLKGRVTAGAGSLEDLSPTQVTAMLDALTPSAKGLAPASGGGTTNFLRADGTWAAPAGTGGTATSPMTFNYTGAAQPFTVPTGVTALDVVVAGGAGGDAQGLGPTVYVGGGGSVVTATIPVTPGEVLQINVGAKGLTHGAGSFNGGGHSSYDSGSNTWGGSGGGGSDIRQGGTALFNRVVVAGAGGGPADTTRPGGAGGLNGTDGSGPQFGHGGTQSAGGASGSNGSPTPGTLGLGGNAGAFGGNAWSGAGGGGYWGGGGGGGGGGDGLQSGGGGGSSLVPAGGSASAGTNTVDGSVVLTWTVGGGGSAPSGPAGGSLAGTYPNPVIAPNTVGTSEIVNGSILGTDIGNNTVQDSNLAVMSTATFKGRLSAGTGSPENLTGTQATAFLDSFTTTLKGLAPASGGGTTNYLRADGTWTAPPVTTTLAATAVSVTPTGFLSATNVQAALAELDGDLAALPTLAIADSVIAATPKVPIATGGGVTTINIGNLVTLTDAQTVTNKVLGSPTLSGFVAIRAAADTLSVNDGANTMEMFGNLGQIARFAFYHQGGSGASPAQTGVGSILGQVVGRGYTGTAYAGGNNVAMNMVSEDAVTTSARGGRIGFTTTAVGTTTAAEALRIQNDASVTVRNGVVGGAGATLGPAAAGYGLESRAGAIGYGVGTGVVAATQITNRTTAITANALTGQITLFAAAGSATWSGFNLLNNTLGANDTIHFTQKSGTNQYNMIATSVTAGTAASVYFQAIAGTATDSPVFQFTVMRGSTT